jgi:exodeoxyribonuclease VII small subunit
MSSENENFENKLQKANQIIEQLSNSELPLDKSVALYKEGMKTLEAATKQLSDAKLEFEQIEATTGNSNG